jgi:uncharacterized OB-fold protein
MSSPRAVPRLDSNNRAFWTGGADGALKIMHCNACATYLHPPRPVCRVCRSENVTPKAVAGAGVVDSFTINYQKWRPDLEVPYVIARVALDGAPEVYLTTNIVNCKPEEVDVGDKVRVIFERQGDIYYPLFEKIA